ncbi:MAG: peptidoglycan endopeptidase [Desulfobacterota bacterium]|nr:peptidoglycan endopeptidase [Thermodesulfobacteriota bacterium]MDW8001612.1 peptidoglycan endopeptidase [Deltaproteobacteria bacterium]
MQNLATFLFIFIFVFLNLTDAYAQRSIPQNRKLAKKVASTQTVLEQTEIANPDVEFIRHRVKRGETLAEIARMYGVSVHEIRSLNGLRSKRISAGKILVIPKRLNEEKEEEIPEFTYGRWKDPNERYMLVKVAKSFVGAPYKLGGSSVRGIDCSAYVKKIFEIFDVNLPRTAKDQFKVGRRIEKDELAIGDLVFFKTRPGKDYPTHVGIYIGNGKFIHASSHNKRGVRIDSLDSDFYRRTYVGAVRVKELPEDLKEERKDFRSDLSS